MESLDATDWELEYDDSERDPDVLDLEDEAQANTRLRSLKHWREELKRVHDIYDEEKNRIMSWKSTLENRINKRIAWNENALKCFLWSTNKKTIDLPYGVLKRRKGMERIDVVLEDTFVDWCGKGGHLDLCHTKLTPDKKAIKSFVQESGEEPPGVELNVSEDSFSVTISRNAQNRPLVDGFVRNKQTEQFGENDYI